jgi:hypothetical protein
MKKFIFITGLFLTTLAQAKSDTTARAVQAQPWSDISLFELCRFAPTGNTNRPLMWFSHEEGKYYLEARMDFDWSNTAALLVGRTFFFHKKHGNNFWITPKFGFLISLASGGFNGLTPECNYGGKIGNVKIFCMDQMAVSLNASNQSFFYHYVQFSYDLKYFAVNAAGQVTQFVAGTNQKPYLDLGPQVVIPIGKFWCKPWVTYDPVHTIKKFVIGVGYRF